MDPGHAFRLLFEDPTPELTELILELFQDAPGVFFAIAADGTIRSSGGRDTQHLPFDMRRTSGRHYRDVLRGHPRALANVERALAGERFEVQSEFAGRYYETRYSPVVRDGVFLGTLGVSHDVTVQKRMEQELQTHQTLYRTVIETTDTGFVMLDREGLVVDANDEYVRMTGHSSLEELRGRRVTEWTAPHDLERNREEVDKCLRYGMTRNLRIDYLDLAGRIVPIEINATYVYVDGQPRILSLCRDVSARLASEETLRETEALNRAVIASLPDAVVVLDARGAVLGFNDGWRAQAESCGVALPSTRADGGTYVDLMSQASGVGAADRQALAAGLAAILSGERVEFRHECTARCPDGERWILVRARALAHEGGGVLVTHSDLTELHLARAATESSERRLATLVDLAPVGVFQAGPQGDCQFVNRTWCRFAGLSAAEARGQGWLEALHPDDRQRVHAAWSRAASQGQDFALDYRFRTEAGVETWVQGQAVPLRDAQGRVTGYIGTVSDITERKALEAQSEAHTRALEAVLHPPPAGSAG